MPQSVTPMIHVPDVRATKEWYESIGFVVTGTNEVDGDIDWARLSFGDGHVMLSEGGRLSPEDRRDVDRGAALAAAVGRWADANGFPH